MTCEEAGHCVVELIKCMILSHEYMKAGIVTNSPHFEKIQEHEQKLIVFFKEHSIKEGLSLLQVQQKGLAEVPETLDEAMKQVDQLNAEQHFNLMIKSEQKMQKAKEQIKKQLIANPSINWGFFNKAEGLIDTMFSPAECLELKHYIKHVKMELQQQEFINAPPELKQKVEQTISYTGPAGYE